MAATTHVPIILFARFTTLAGEHPFSTSVIDALPYASLRVTTWRALMEHPTWLCSLSISESTDKENWTELLSLEIAANQERVGSASITKRYLRATIVVEAGGAFPVVTCYAVGLLAKRV